MALQDISLPVDVPWTLLATSNDMLATHQSRFPHAMWKPSVAVFSYDPTADDLADIDAYVGKALTFLKVVVSVTSYSPPCENVPVPVQYYEPPIVSGAARNAAYGLYQQAVSNVNAAIHQTYPCSGALLQVAIYPRGQGQDTTDVDKLAYFAAFEPKKRELLEVATDSGESLTQSKSDLNVKKGVTSTQSTEDLDVFTGVNAGAGFAGASANVGVSGQWGTIKRSGSQQENVTTSDAQRDARESASHTTTISQLYHLLNSYHLGTNRAIFFLNSRPHTQQQKDQFTFINGPQDIEGVQEFFLVVVRPDDRTIDDYCVDALLYTAHLDGDELRNAIAEPKTAETSWIDIWTTKPGKAAKGGLSIMQIVGLVFGVPTGNPVDLATNALQTVENDVDALQKAWTDQFSGASASTVHIQTPALFDGYLTPDMLNDPTLTSLPTTLAPPMGNTNGWQIDRTRGLGGYDLWEDPANRSADPLGNHDNSKPYVPQALVDIVSAGSPDDLVNYHPDYALRIRAAAWPWTGSNSDALYHASVKAYFIRNDLPTDQRTVDMFVTARGVSTCPGSPFFEFSPDDSILVPEIAAEDQVHPPSIAPWISPRATTVAASASTAVTSTGSGNSSQPKTTAPAVPLNSSQPSGLDHYAIGAARAKMANAVGADVRSRLVSSIKCLPGGRVSLYPWARTDTYFKTISKALLGLEIQKLAASPRSDLTLVRQIAKHPMVTRILPIGHTALHGLRMLAGDNGTGGTSVDTTGFPALTLKSPTLTEEDQRRLREAKVSTALDLVGLSAAQSAQWLGIEVDQVRRLRLRMLGYEAPEPEATKAE